MGGLSSGEGTALPYPERGVLYAATRLECLFGALYSFQERLLILANLFTLTIDHQLIIPWTGWSWLPR
jgi:hypothetical protein